MKPLQTALETAKSALKIAQDQLTQAQTAKKAADEALARAKETAMTDAEKYGNDVQINNITAKAGTQTLPELTMANPEQSPVAHASYMVLMAAAKESLPAMLYGTKLSWNKLAQALRDLANAGDYTEEALVTFPDGFTVVKKFALHVTAPATVNNGGNHNDASIYEPYHILILFDATTNKEITRQTAKQVDRPDVARAFGDTRTAGDAGFNNTFTSFKPVAGYYYKLVSRYSLKADANSNYTDYWLDIGKLN